MKMGLATIVAIWEIMAMHILFLIALIAALEHTDFISELHEQITVVQVVTADSTLATQLENDLGLSNVVRDTTHNDHVHIQVANPDG